MELAGPNAPSDSSGRPAPSLYYLRTFQAVATARSYTRAARGLHLSQPAVSAHIRTLERYYGAPLFKVRQRRVFLTEVGDVLFAYTRRVFNLLGEADSAAAATQRGERGSMRLGASATVGIYLLPSVLGRYSRSHPDVEVEIAIGTSRDVVAWVLAESVPFAIVEAPESHRDLDVRALGEDELTLIVPRGHPWAETRVIGPAALARQAVLRRELGSGTRVLVDCALASAGVVPPTGAVLGNTEALKHAVLAGMGVAWVPSLAVRREIAAGELIPVAVEGLSIRRSLSLVTLRGAGLSTAAEALVSLVRLAAANACRPSPPAWSPHARPDQSAARALGPSHGDNASNASLERSTCCLRSPVVRASPSEPSS